MKAVKIYALLALMMMAGGVKMHGQEATEYPMLATSYHDGHIVIENFGARMADSRFQSPVKQAFS